jgi:hypothetical protein
MPTGVGRKVVIMYVVTNMSVDELANKIHRDYMLGWITEDEYRDALECLADKILERGNK